MMKKIILFLLLAIYFIKGQSQHISVNQIVNEVVYLCDNYPYGKIPTPNDTTKVFLLALDKVEDTLIMGVSRVKTDTQFYRTSPTYFLMTSMKIFCTRRLVRLSETVKRIFDVLIVSLYLRV